MNQLIKFFHNKQLNTLLDIGTGNGNFLMVLKQAFPKTKFTGIDPDADSLKKAKELHPNVSFIPMVAEDLKFPDNSFDVVTISMALHHLPHVAKSLKEIQRVVKSDGWVIISEIFSDNLNPAQEVHKLFHHFRSKTHRILGISHNKTFKREEIIKMIESSGISIHFQFDFIGANKPVTDPQELEGKIEKMKAMLESVKDYPEYETLKPKIEDFRKRAQEFGFQSATRVVVVGKKQ